MRQLRNAPVVVFRGLAVVCLTLALALAVPAVEAATEAVEAVVEMSCFPAPGAPLFPPCLVPLGLPEDFLDGTSGTLSLRVAPDGRTELDFQVSGLDPEWTLTAWISYFFPPGPAPDPIFEGTAGISAPAAATTAAFTEGLAPEPNQLRVHPDGRGRLKVTLDYNPLTAGEGPLRSDLVVTEQTMAAEGSGAEQGTCCEGLVQPIGTSFLRVFDPLTGFQELDDNGRPVLLRSPVPVAFMLIVIHLDNTTHGINPGQPIFPFPGVPAAVGDHLVLGIFDLAELLPG